MSFGGSPGDFITAGALALRAYRACKAAAGEFAEVTREVSAVSILVKDLEEQATNPSFAQKQAEIRSLIDGIIYALRELEQLATKYSSLSTAKKNNWDRLRFATKSIDDIRSRLILHTCAAQSFLDGLANRSVIRIERKSDETNAALARVEQVLADIVKDIKHGSREPSIVSDEKWNIWTELKRELRIEGYPVEVVQRHKDQIKQYLLNLLQDAGLQDEILLDELDPSEINGSADELQSLPSTQIPKATITTTLHWKQIQSPSLTHLTDFLSFSFKSPTLSLAFAIAIIVASLLSTKEHLPPFANKISPTHPSNLTSPTETEAIFTMKENQVLLELKAGLFKNEHTVVFGCSSGSQAQVWIDQLSPLFDPNLADESAIKVRPLSPPATEQGSRALQADTATTPAQLTDASAYCPQDPSQLGTQYRDIYFKPPDG